MLYVSRQAKRGYYVVVDTDDNTEEICDYDELREAVVDLGLDVKGVTKVPTPSGNYLIRVVPYRAENDRKFTKMSIFGGVDMVVNDGVLSRFCIMQEDAKMTIVLSDYCTEIAPYAFSSKVNNHNVVIVLDKKIKIKRNSVRDIAYTGITFDITEVSDKTAKYFYTDLRDRAFYNVDGFDKTNWSFSGTQLVDRDDRFCYHLCERIMQTLWCDPSKFNFTLLRQTFEGFDEILWGVIKTHKKGMFETLDCEIVFKEGTHRYYSRTTRRYEIMSTEEIAKGRLADLSQNINTSRDISICIEIIDDCLMTVNTDIPYLKSYFTLLCEDKQKYTRELRELLQHYRAFVDRLSLAVGFIGR